MRALVALSADPLTLGHLDLILKAKAASKELIVLISTNDLKKDSYTFSLEERYNMVVRAINDKGIKDVRVIKSNGILADIYLEYGCDSLIRGIRNESDRAYEEAQMEFHKTILPSMKVAYFNCNKKYKIVSSSAMKAWTEHYIDTSEYVPLFIKQQMEERISGQYKIAITGRMATGKSWVARELAHALKWKRFSSKIIGVDDLLYSLYTEDSRGAENLRQDINNLIQDAGGPNIILSDTVGLDCKALSSFIFSEKADLLPVIEQLTAPHIMRKYREALKNFKGVVILEWAQIAEMHLGKMTNNNVIVVDSPDHERLINNRKIDPKTYAARSKHQWSADVKIEELTAQIKIDHAGEVIRYSNTLENSKINDLADQVISQFGLRR